MISKFHLVDFINSALKWKKPIIILCLIAIIGSGAIGISMDKIYESITTIYPANPSLTDKSTLFNSGNNGNSVELYGSKEDVDRIISIAKSGQVLVHVIHKFNLFDHYKVKIDEVKGGHYDAAISKLKKNLDIVKTEYRGVEIKVRDKNKDLAAKIANEIVAKADEVAQTMIMESRNEIKKMFDTALEEKLHKVDEITDSLTDTKKKYARYLLMNIEEKAEILTKDITSTKVSLRELQAQHTSLTKQYKKGDLRLVSLSSQINGLQERLNTLNEEWLMVQNDLKVFAKAEEIIKILELKQEFAIDELKTHQKTHDYYTLSANQSVSFIYVMEKAYPADTENNILPLIIIGSFLVTLVISIVTATVIDKLNERKVA
jgi:capsular polysaccharide biosynthesis protein